MRRIRNASARAGMLRGCGIVWAALWLTWIGPAPVAAAPGAPAGDVGDSGFGPLVVIERIEIEGNTSTSEALIRRALPIRTGDAMRAGDPRMVTARYKVLALGYFRTVDVSLRKGTFRGNVVVTVAVVERGTITLDGLHLGTARATPWWAGVDLTERNFLGTGFGVGAGLVFAGRGQAQGARSQRAFELRLANTALLDSAAGIRIAGTYVRASEPYRIAGDASDDSPEHFAAFDYERIGARAGMDFQLTPIIRIALGARVERVEAGLPALPTRVLGDGSSERVELFLKPGVSRVVTARARFDRDTRDDPVLTTAGDRVLLHGELGATWLGGSYDYGVALAKYQRWWAIDRRRYHVLSAHVTGGVVLGEAPLFDRLHVGSLNRLVSPRALGLVLSTTPSHDFLGTRSDDVTYGELGGVAELQYSYRLFRDRFSIYGGDVFVGAGLWALTQTRDLRVRDDSVVKSLPVDLLVDIGLRVDTQIGIFELSLANALGRLPL